MRYATFHEIGGPDRILIERPSSAPAPGDGEVVVEMRAAGLNRAELMHLGGYYVVPTLTPSRIGIEGAGTVTAIGAGVVGIQVGDEVVVTPDLEIGHHGTLATHALVPAAAIEPKPASLDFADAAAFWVAHGTAYAGLVQDGGLRSGADQAVVISASSSSVGLAAIQIAKAHGATVIATTRTDAKSRRLLDAGADHVIATSTTSAAAAIADITDGRGFDIAFDSVAGSWIDELTTVAAPGARLVIYGGQSGEPTTAPLLQMLVNDLRLSALHFVFDVLRDPERRSDVANHLAHGIERGAYRPVIDSTFAFDDTVAAYERMASNEQFGKIVVTFDHESAT